MANKGRRVAAPLIAALAAWAWAAPAGAVQYESEIDIENEQDLYDLQLEGEITESTLETLLELFRNGVDLNAADSEELYELPNITYAEVRAILSYRKLVGRIDNPSDLVAANVISAKLLTQIAPFLLVTDADPRGASSLSGRAQMGVGYTNTDSGAPPIYLRSQLKGPFNLSGGLLALTTRRRLGEIGYDATRDAMTADRPSYAFHLPKLYLQWKSSKVSVIAGSFRIGFGERLTLDNTTKNTPDGFYPDDVVYTPQDLETACKESKGELGDSPCSPEERANSVTPDFSWRDGFRGVAARLDAPLGEMRLKATVFGSYQSRSIYQYELFDRRDCDDPHSSNSSCDAPPVYVRTGDIDTSKFSYMTLPDVYDELAGGGNLTLKLGPNGYVGLTGYYARTTWNEAPLELDFQEWSRTPYGGPFGAVGVSGGLMLGMVNLFVEGARSFDSMTDGNGGGFGVIQRTTLSAAAQELELTLRYYGRDFANPYARGTAAPDEYDGLRARNEAGARLRYRGVTGDWVYSGDADFWFWPEDAKDPGTAGTRHFAAKARAQFAGYDAFQPWLSLEYKNKDLDNNLNSYETADGEVQAACYESGDEEGLDGEARPCSGSFYRAAAGVKIVPIREVSFDLRYQHEWLNDAKHPGDMRQDSVLRATIAYKPIKPITIRLRSRYLYEDISSNTQYEQSLWSYLQVSWLATKQLRASVRYDNYYYLDERSSTLERPSLFEHRARLELEANF